MPNHDNTLVWCLMTVMCAVGYVTIADLVGIMDLAFRGSFVGLMAISLYAAIKEAQNNPTGEPDNEY